MIDRSIYVCDEPSEVQLHILPDVKIKLYQAADQALRKEENSISAWLHALRYYF